MGSRFRAGGLASADDGVRPRMKAAMANSTVWGAGFGRGWCPAGGAQRVWSAQLSAAIIRVWVGPALAWPYWYMSVAIAARRCLNSLQASRPVLARRWIPR